MRQSVRYELAQIPIAESRAVIKAEQKSFLRLAPLVRDFSIDYTAQSLVEPEEVHLRDRLGGRMGTGQGSST